MNCKFSLLNNKLVQCSELRQNKQLYQSTAFICKLIYQYCSWLSVDMRKCDNSMQTEYWTWVAKYVKFYTIRYHRCAMDVLWAVHDTKAELRGLSQHLCLLVVVQILILIILTVK